MYASPHEAEIRKQVAELLTDGVEREAIVDVLHQTYYDRPYLASLVSDVVNPKTKARLTGTVLTLFVLMGAYGSLATLFGILLALSGRFSLMIVVGPLFLGLALLTRFSKRVSSYHATAMASGYMLFLRLRFADPELFTPLGLLELAWLGSMAWLAHRSSHETRAHANQLVVERSFTVPGGWTDEAVRHARDYWQGRGVRVGKVTAKGLHGSRGSVMTGLPTTGMRRLRAKLRINVVGSSEVDVRLTTETGLSKLTEADRALFRLELLEFQSVLQGAGTFGGVWEAVARLQQATRRGYRKGQGGRIPKPWMELLDELERANFLGPDQHERVQDVIRMDPIGEGLHGEKRPIAGQNDDHIQGR